MSFSSRESELLLLWRSANVWNKCSVSSLIKTSWVFMVCWLGTRLVGRKEFGRERECSTYERARVSVQKPLYVNLNECRICCALIFYRFPSYVFRCLFARVLYRLACSRRLTIDRQVPRVNRFNETRSKKATRPYKNTTQNADTSHMCGIHTSTTLVRPIVVWP